MLQVGIVGLPNSGKSTLFNALAKARAPVAGHPFTTVDPNVGMAAVPDPRLARLAAALGRERVMPAHVRFVDIAGLVRGAHRGEGLGNRFLAHIREADAVLLVLRGFRSGTVPHPEGDVDPVRDLETLTTELMLADLETAERALPKAEKTAQGTRDDRDRARAEATRKAVEALERGSPVRAGLSEDELPSLADASLLTAKPVLHVVNVGEEALGDQEAAVASVREALAAPAEVVAVCAKLEEEVEDLPSAEAAELLAGYGIEERGTERIAAAARRLLGLITFYTIESDECRAWLVREGTSAREAAGEIHTDMMEGFIRADVVAADGLADAGSVPAARDRGLVRSEGREYPVRDGEVLTFRFRD